MYHFYSLSIAFILTTFCIAGYSQSQIKNEPKKPLSIKKAQGEIILDGVINETDWQKAEVATNFFLNYPIDTASAPYQTEARLTFTDQALYVSFVCYDNTMKFISQSLRRDFQYDKNDNVVLIIGPYNDAINGFFFGITPENVQLEGTISTGGAEDGSYNEAWDNKWFSKVKKYEDKWVAELMIPFKSIRFKSGVKTWNITFQRFDLKRNTISSWIATPIQYNGTSFAYSGNLIWDELPQKSTNISIIPYLAGGLSRDSQTDPVTKKNDLQAGFDAKVGITPSLNLDLTLNPDFSQVEVDNQVINLSRFEFQFPERRQFFLENNDLFEKMGFPGARPFFSRRVGLARDSSGTLQRVPIWFGTRLSGSLSKKWRLSLLNMMTKEKLSLGLPTQNYTVATLQKNFWAQSTVQLSFVNKQSIGISNEDSLKYFNSDLWKQKLDGNSYLRVLNSYNRNVALDLDLRNKTNSWYTSSYLTGSFDNFNTKNILSGGGFISYTKRNYKISGGHTFVQKNYNAEAGYVPSNGVYPGISDTFLNLEGTIFPKGKKNILAKMGSVLQLSVSSIPNGTITDKGVSIGYYFNFLNTSLLSASYSYTFQQLTKDFNPIDDSKFTNFLVAEEYDWHQFSVAYSSNQRKLFRYSIGLSNGSFYNGSKFNANGTLSYRVQPYGSISLNFDYNDLRLGKGYGDAKLFIASPRLDLTMTDKIFLTTFLQYNTASDNANINVRFQWRYKPASDFFLIYTENYLPENFTSKNRTIVFKLTYWFNL